MDVVISLWENGLINVREQAAALRYSMNQATKVAEENPY